MHFLDHEVLSYSPALPSDFDELHLLRIDAMRESLLRIGRYDPERSMERFRASFDCARTRHILLGSRRIGFLAVRSENNILMLDHLYLRPYFHGEGIGTRVLMQVFHEADAAGLSVQVSALRESDANRFYMRHGFQKIGEEEWDIHYLRNCSRMTNPADGKVRS